MNILVTGMDGYLGHPLAMHLSARGHRVFGIDDFSRRARVEEVGSWSATPIKPMEKRLEAHQEATDREIMFYEGDLTEPSFVDAVLKKEMPECIIHLGEIPSAPYSMIDLEHCNATQMNNIVGTNNILFAMKRYVPDCHLVKLGTMGEYKIPPDGKIPEAAVSEFPRAPGSYYHASKVAGSVNVELTCLTKGIRATDIHQGVVHGIATNEMLCQTGCIEKEYNEDLLTRFDFDEVWGTALNRFCAQAVIGHCLTPYGLGGQTRGYIALRDSIQCMTIIAENPPEVGEYRPLNQFSECYSVNELAEHVANIYEEFGGRADIWNIENPRVEAEEHYYNPDHDNLRKLGFEPTYTLDDELRVTIPLLMRYRRRIEEKSKHIMPTVKWRN